MDIFYIIVLTIAVVLLILILTYVGLTMSSVKSKLKPFPPTTASCPDYWNISPTDPSFCVVPKFGSKNTGDSYDTAGKMSLKTSNTFGYDSTKSIVDFTNSSWDGTGVTSLCAKKKWANNHGIYWDGVSNSNSC